MKKQKLSITVRYLLPSFFSGAATTLNLAGNFYTHRLLRIEEGWLEDRIALRNDFEAIGQDFGFMPDKQSSSPANPPL